MGEGGDGAPLTLQFSEAIIAVIELALARVIPSLRRCPLQYQRLH